MNHKTVKIYYTFLLLVLGIKVITTIFSNGLSVHHGKKIARLQLQKNNLVQQQMKLKSELASKSSLTQIAQNYDTSEFVTISNPIVINQETSVASN